MNEFLQLALSQELIVNNLVYNKITRCPTNKKPRGKDGAFYFDGVFGWVQNHQYGGDPVIYKSTKVISPNQAAEYQAARDKAAKKYAEDRRINQNRAALQAKSMIGLQEVSNYMLRKGLEGIKTNVVYELIDNERRQVTVIPMLLKGQIIGAQKIYDDKKRFIFGQRTKDAYFKIGSGKQAFLTEGYASGISLQLTLSKILTDYCIYVCFSASNIINLAKAHPNAYVIADNDKSETGQNAAMDTGLKWIMPDKEGYDWNDYHRENEFLAVMKMKRFLMEVKKMEITVTKEFADSFDLCMKHYECTEEEIAYERQRARDNYLDASACFISVAKNLQ